MRSAKDQREERMLLAAFCAMGILSDPTDLTRIRRNGKKLTCERSVAVRAVRQADAILKEIER